MEQKVDLDKLRHSCSHVMAQAVKELWPDVKVTIGPSIDNGFYYDFDRKDPFTPEDLEKIEKAMRRIIQGKPAFVQNFLSKDDAVKLFSGMNETYKIELIREIPDEKVSIYKTGDGFVDLCKGPHVANAGEIKAFKLLSVAGAYWHGDEKNPMLQRIYGTCFASQKELDDYLRLLEEAKNRDHRKLGPALELFDMYPDQAGAGLIFYHPQGAMVRKTIEDYLREQNTKRGYEFVMTPHMLKGHLWEISGHAGYYRENMYFFKVDQEEYAVKPMNCPGHILIYQSKTRSYRDLPIRFFELGTVYRQEKAGVLHGLLRVRGFTQDDAHIFCREDQIKSEVIKAVDFVFDVMKDFGFKDMEIEISTRPAKFIGKVEDWDTATQALKDSLDDKKLVYKINEGDGAFYGPKIDIKLKDALNRSWQCATIQCDFALPERFKLEYISETGEARRPIMLHRAILGSLERFLGMLIEHYAGAFPAWLAPVQVMIIPIKDEHKDFSEKLKENLESKNLRVKIDSSNETLSKRIREATVKKVPYILIAGDKEVADGKIAVRKRSVGDQGRIAPEEFLEQILGEIKNKS
ncbi:MAG TPA: threonine--tRNA ligase [Candidatus Omnitrophota bacterium]|nr:threonine--tRNA ligase [Candidatus Omnitrophota bacterium]HPD84580.1 threonine--tRNA ligase [Candidatus Omnitrophota bacterium]HRZ03438.1 threonine--tRNA ligase [Candidatus Omnitrophota bacterium]